MFVVITGDCPRSPPPPGDFNGVRLDALSCDIHRVHDRIVMFMLVEGVVYARHGLGNALLLLSDC